MHNTMIGTSGMDHEPHPAHDHSPYGTNSEWVDGGFHYIPTPLQSDSLGRTTAPSTTIHPQPLSASPSSSQQHSHHPQPPMVILPSYSWPSMFTNPVTYPAPPLPVPAVAPPPPPPPAKPPRANTSTPRRTLTDEDRREMCLYNEKHPGVKQMDIGKMFGVERSTVSKVLRHKDKFLNQEDNRSDSVAKRTKGKLPDIERALAAWARKTQQAGRELTDGEIWEKVRHFGHGVNGIEHVQKLGDPWLEKFKKKHGIGHTRASRRASETSVSTDIKLSMSTPPLLHSQHSQHSSRISPASPTVQASPLSGTRSDDELKDGGMSSFNRFRTDMFNPGNNQSTTSPSSALTDAGTSSFSGSAVSPTGPFAFSPDSNVGGFLADQRHFHPGPETSYHRPRSLTFPTLDIEFLNQDQTANLEPTTPKYPVSSTAPSSALESPARELDARHYALNSVVVSSSPQLDHSNSNGNLAAAAKASHIPSPATSMMPPPISPTIEDARRGLDLALSYVQRSASRYDEDDLMAVLRFFENVGLRQYTKAPGSSIHPMSGLSRIPEGGEVEMGNAPAPAKLETMMA
ncbi:uncharacterized protein DNG_03859 [Cephalotrichum gorgonifer]|uniref:HTH CENPB-type domain-containing protein n=1 Tax=Cephalotrichum gorgonifer TaxID=2041049 RepID=A0AAE8SUN4_9PEZI|nr:uncharacterized protein DNG_03859 [Cephalotrichum gorgonifer]